MSVAYKLQNLNLVDLIKTPYLLASEILEVLSVHNYEESQEFERETFDSPEVQGYELYIGKCLVSIPREKVERAIGRRTSDYEWEEYYLALEDEIKLQKKQNYKYDNNTILGFCKRTLLISMRR